jgi:hypothetical protein
MQIFSNKRHFLPEIPNLAVLPYLREQYRNSSWEAGVLEVSPAGGWW